MGDKTAIVWLADALGNPGATWEPTKGCSQCSPGCVNCYAKKYAHRFDGPGLAYEGFSTAKGWTGKVEIDPEHLTDPLRWKRPRRIFVNSRSDLFHEQLGDAQVFAVWRVMAAAARHTFLVLTKRADRMRSSLGRLSDAGPADVEPVMFRDGKHSSWVTDEQARRVLSAGRATMFHAWVESLGKPPPGCAAPTYDWAEGPRWWPLVLPNVWAGVSVDDRKHGLPRIEELRQTPAALRFLSIEPLLEDLGELDLTGIGWVIVGGESGPSARPFGLNWARSIVQQCRAASVPCFVKQLGAVPYEHAERWGRGDWKGSSEVGPLRLKHRAGADPAEWPQDLQNCRAFPEVSR